MGKRLSKTDKTTENVLIAAAVSPIGYELDALAWMDARLRAQGRKKLAARDPVVENAYLEAMLVHARCLIEFLVKGGDDRYLRRYHYLDAPVFELPDAQHAPAMDYHAKISTHLAHLTWDRVRASDIDELPEWTDKLAADVLDMFDLFIDALRERRPGLVQPFANAMSVARSRAPRPSSERRSFSTTDTLTVIGVAARPEPGRGAP